MGDEESLLFVVLPEAEVTEHPHEVVVVDAVACIYHQGFCGVLKDIDIASAGRLEAVQGSVVLKLQHLIVGIKIVTDGIVQSLAVLVDLHEDIFRVVAQLLELKGDAVYVGQEA